MDALTKRHFFHHGPDDPALAAERRKCHLCQIRDFETHKAVPITIVNETEDGATLPPNFRFIHNSVISDTVDQAEDSFRSGCTCDDDEECMYRDCLCLQEQDDSSDDGDNEYRPAPKKGQKRRKKFAYHSSGPKEGLLRSKWFEGKRTKAIYECHEKCACSKDCPNRVVERGRTIPLQIFRTDNRGWGVRTLVDIRKGQFVDRYLGEIITGADADARRASSHSAQRKDVYLFALDKFSNPESIDPRLQSAPLEVDGEFMSGPTRFINHSCAPNLRILARVGDAVDKHIHDLAFFANQDVKKGDELTFDYVDGVEYTPTDPDEQGEMVECLCGSDNCRRFLW